MVFYNKLQVIDFIDYILTGQKLTNLTKTQCLPAFQHLNNDLYTELSTAYVDNSKADNWLSVLRSTS